MIAISIKTNVADVKRSFALAPQLTKNAIQTALSLSGTEVRRLMREEVPKKSNTLQRSIQSIPGNMSISIGPNMADAPYALYVHEGTRPHTILPRNKKALYWKGALHPVRRVNHPGTKPNRFVDRTAGRAQSIVEKIFRLSIDKLVRDIAK